MEKRKKDKSEDSGEERSLRWGLCIDKRVHSQVGEVPDPEDEWSTPDVHNSTSMLGLRLVGDAVSADVTASFEPVAGESLHLLWVEYSTGDSFHNEDGCCEPVGVYRTLRLANLARAELEAACDAPHPIAIFDEDGSVRMMSVCWSGYFDSFQEAHVDTLKVGPALFSKPSRSRP